ncbi:MAG: hypothetical protein S4CHLAM123_04660 [Chlamydiales bacterium]|nr:hypothetical protein [Chlamydiales bacterium]
MASKLYVGNLSHDITDNELQDIFEAYGSVVSAQVIVDRETRRSKGFGFVEMSSADEAQAAIEALNEKEVQGRPLTVNIARPRENRTGGGGGGFRGGNRNGGGGGGAGGRRY